jgi:hypothetical protein
MPFPEHIDRVFDAYRVAPDTKAALFDLYVSLGAEVLEVFGDMAEQVESPAQLRPEDTIGIRRKVVERYLRRVHPRWQESAPTPSLWHPRELEGRASGLAMPLGPVGKIAHSVVGEDQPVPAGIVMLGRNAHYGGRVDTVSFDVVAADLDDALALALAEGQQHTMPGSAGETSGTYDAVQNVALLWEIQPNVYKPAGERNRSIAKLYRRHRNWHLLTLVAALEWLSARGCAIYVLRGVGLAPTHEVNPEKPVSGSIVLHHDRTVARVAEAMGLSLEPVTDLDEVAILDSGVMNHALRKHVLRQGAASVMWRILPASR